MEEQTEIPKEIAEIMSYLSYSFSKSMRDTINSEEDLFNDLVVLYLENINGGEVKNTADKNQWFTFFKSRLTNKYNRVIHERGLINQLKIDSKR